jgi:drug/metabolite transporter (DMT)-like permease
VVAVTAGGLAVAGARKRLVPDIRPGMTPKQITDVSTLGFLAALVTVCIWACGYAAVRKDFPSPSVFAGALLRLSLSLSVLI